MKLYHIAEARLRTHRPAIITMKRGTVIKADHARMVQYPTGRSYLVVGVKPGLYETEMASASLSKNGSFVRRLRDFYAPGEYIPAPYQDETGWDEPLGGETPEGWHAVEAYNSRPCGGRGPGGYSAHRYYIKKMKFEKIMTINPENILGIKWL